MAGEPANTVPGMLEMVLATVLFVAFTIIMPADDPRKAWPPLGPKTSELGSCGRAIAVPAVLLEVVMGMRLVLALPATYTGGEDAPRSEEHTSELQSPCHI